jgi:hypothetical protein
VVLLPFNAISGVFHCIAHPEIRLLGKLKGGLSAIAILNAHPPDGMRASPFFNFTTHISPAHRTGDASNVPTQSVTDLPPKDGTQSAPRQGAYGRTFAVTRLQLNRGDFAAFSARQIAGLSVR